MATTAVMSTRDSLADVLRIMLTKEWASGITRVRICGPGMCDDNVRTNKNSCLAIRTQTIAVPMVVTAANPFDPTDGMWTIPTFNDKAIYASIVDSRGNLGVGSQYSPIEFGVRTNADTKLSSTGSTDDNCTGFLFARIESSVCMIGRHHSDNHFTILPYAEVDMYYKHAVADNYLNNVVYYIRDVDNNAIALLGTGAELKSTMPGAVDINAQVNGGNYYMGPGIQIALGYLPPANGLGCPSIIMAAAMERRIEIPADPGNPIPTTVPPVGPGEVDGFFNTIRFWGYAIPMINLTSCGQFPIEFAITG